MVMITLFSHNALRKSFLLQWPCIFTFFLKRNHFPPPFPARCGLETNTPEGVRCPRRSNMVTRPPLICSFHPPLPHSSTSTRMMPVKGFLPNLSALMFASVLSHTHKSKNKCKIIKEWVKKRKGGEEKISEFYVCVFDGFCHDWVGVLLREPLWEQMEC